jgi:putative phosphoribosyl transferase
VCCILTLEFTIERGGRVVHGDQTAIPSRFRDRAHAGRCLGSLLSRYAGRDDVVVLALPGGVPVGLEIAIALPAPLDVCVVRKLGVPGHEELAFGAVGRDGTRVLNDDVVRLAGLDDELIEEVAARECAELERRELLYRGERAPVPLEEKVVVLVDDGLATGASMRAAIQVVKISATARIVVAIPAGATETCAALEREVDELVCAIEPESFFAVSLWYEHFEQLTDTEVRALLEHAPGLGER